MVLIKNPIKSAMVPIAATALLSLDGCNKDDEVGLSKTDLLIGDWKLTELDGYLYNDLDYTYFFKFQKSGDWQFCYTEGDPTQYCYSGKWSWENSNETSIIFSQLEGEPVGTEWRLDVVVLDATRLEGTFIYEVGYSQSIKFVKVQ